MVNQNIIKAKINHIERSLQLSIQGCIDIASHIISDQGWIVPDTLAGLFDILMEHKIISQKLEVWVPEAPLM